MRDLHNFDIKNEANQYALERSSENYREVRDSFIDGFFFAVEKIEQEYTTVSTEINGVILDVLVKKRDL